MAFASPKCYALITPVDVVLGSLDRRMRKKNNQTLANEDVAGRHPAPKIMGSPPPHLPNPPGPAAPLTIGVLRRVHKRIRKRCNYRVIP